MLRSCEGRSAPVDRVCGETTVLRRLKLDQRCLVRARASTPSTSEPSARKATSYSQNAFSNNVVGSNAKRKVPTRPQEHQSKRVKVAVDVDEGEFRVSCSCSVHLSDALRQRRAELLMMSNVDALFRSLESLSHI